MSLKLWWTCWSLFASFSIFSQDYQDYVEPNTLLPFPVKSGWTFINADADSLVYPVYDSLVMREFGADSYFSRFIAMDSTQHYGILSAEREVDTIAPFIYDSLFQRGFSFFARREGAWTRFFQKGLSLEKVIMGTVESWYDDGEHLYYEKDGKTGLFPFYTWDCIPAAYNFICPFDSQVKVRNQAAYFTNYFLVSDGDRFGLIEWGRPKELIPVVAKSIQRYHYGFYRYWQGYWKYLRLSDGMVIDPKGDDVVLYNETTWKICNPERTRGTLYLKSGAVVLSGAYEDYFPLENGTIAVRRNGLVGLLNASGNVLFSCRYEQVDALGENRFRCLENGEWYLCDQRGRKLNSEGFVYIGETGNSDEYLEVHANSKKGLLSVNGVLAIAAEYDNIYSLTGFFVLETGRNLAVANSKAKLMSEPVYDNYLLDSQLVVMRLGGKHCELYSQAGKLNNEPCVSFLNSGDVVKCYSEKLLEIVILESDLNTVSERQLYPGMQSFVVGGMPERKWKHYPAGKIMSHLEEHQLSGFFGYRRNWAAGHLKTPSFREVTEGSTFNYDYGTEAYAETGLPVNDTLSFTAQFRIQAVDAEAGTFSGEPFVSSTLQAESGGGSSSANRINYLENGTCEWWVTAVTKRPAAAIVFIDYRQQDLFYYNTGGKIVPATDQHNSFSFFDYYRRFNYGDNLAIEPSDIPQFMDPSNRLQVRGGKWYVAIDETQERKKISDGLQSEYYEQLFFDDNWDPDVATYYGKREGETHYTWSFQRSDSITLTGFKEIIKTESDYYKVVSKIPEARLVHPYEPGFVFIPSDSAEWYASGRIVNRSANGWGITSVAGDTIVPAVCSEIVYLTHDRFGLQRNGEWHISDRSGNAGGSSYLSRPGTFENGYAIVRDAAGFSLIDTAQNVYARSESPLKAIGNGLFSFQNNGRNVIIDPVSGMTDTLVTGEQWLSNGWICAEINGTYIRRQGKQKRQYLSVDQPVSVFGDLLILENHGLYTLLDQSGMPVFPKSVKLSRKIQGTGLVCLQSSKRWHFISDKGRILHETPKGKSVHTLGDRLVVELTDTFYALDAAGAFYSVSPLGKLQPLSEQAVQEPEKELAGIGHYTVTGKQGEHFVVEVPSKQGVYSRALTEILPAVYDEVFCYSADFFLVRKGQKVGIVSSVGEWLIPLQLR